MRTSRKSNIVLKTVIVFILSAVLLVVVISSVKCNFTMRTDRYGFFSDSELKELSDMPKIRSSKPTRMEYGTFYYTTTQEEFNQYVKSFYDYIISKPYKYLGTPTKILSTFFGGAPRCEIKLCNELEDFTTYWLDGGYANGGPNRYFFVLGEELTGEKENDTSSYTRVLGRYIKMQFVSDGMVVDKETGFEWNACIELPYSLMDYTFYLYSGASNGFSQEDVIKLGFSCADGIGEPTPWVSIGLECVKEQNKNTQLTIYVGHESGFIENWNRDAWDSNPSYGKFVIERTILDENRNLYSQQYFDLDDFGDDKYLVTHIYDEEIPDKVTVKKYEYNFVDTIDFDEIEIEHGFIQYNFQLVDDDYNVITEALRFGVSLNSRVSFVKDESSVTFSYWNGF